MRQLPPTRCARPPMTMTTAHAPSGDGGHKEQSPKTPTAAAPRPFNQLRTLPNLHPMRSRHPSPSHAAARGASEERRAAACITARFACAAYCCTTLLRHRLLVGYRANSLHQRLPLPRPLPVLVRVRGYPIEGPVPGAVYANW